MSVGEVSLTLLLIETYITVYRLGGYIVSLGGYIVHLCAFYSYKLIGKLTAFFQLQDFSLRNLPVDSSTTASPSSPPLNPKP